MSSVEGRVSGDTAPAEDMVPAGAAPSDSPDAGVSLEAWSDEIPGSGPSAAHEVVPPSNVEQPLTYTFQQQEQSEQRKATERMQQWVLIGVATVLLVVFGLTLAAVWNHGVTPEYALELSRLVLPSLVGSGATIVGALFINGSRRDS
ncbi:hypothetical protein AB0C38_48130 [Amycolatopsis sp. NPDC048633]|uniref:hypothetical protein n=1 Tax=Amycolatopsis sp. NPDC048633 TaxID=3157095 RepID=UPI0033EDED0E